MLGRGVASQGATRSRSVGVLEAGVEVGEVLEGAGGGVGGDAPFAVRRELAPRAAEVLEQEDEGVAVVARAAERAGDQQVTVGATSA